MGEGTDADLTDPVERCVVKPNSAPDLFNHSERLVRRLVDRPDSRRNVGDYGFDTRAQASSVSSKAPQRESIDLGNPINDARPKEPAPYRAEYDGPLNQGWPVLLSIALPGLSWKAPRGARELQRRKKVDRDSRERPMRPSSGPRRNGMY